MTKVLIVDDEILVRVGLRSAIDWYSNGFEIVGEASNGKEALKLLMEGNADIMLMDIKMPVMDGIELLENIRKKGINVRTIVLSCHDEYEYVREALKLGASDYLLKLSLNPKNLLNLLLELKNEIETSELTETINKEEKVEENWQKLLFGFNELIWKEQKDYGVNIRDSKIVVFAVCIDYFARLPEKKQFGDKKLFKNSIKGIMNNIINDYACGDSFQIEEGKYAAVINPRNFERNVLEQIASNIQGALKNYMQIMVSVGVSEIQDSPQFINTAYSQAYEALNRRFFTGNSSILFYEDNKKKVTNENSVLFDLQMEEDLKRAIDLNHPEKAREILQNFFNKIRTMKECYVEAIYRAVDDILYLFSKELKIYGKSFGDMMEFERTSPQYEIRKKEFLDELEEWLLGFADRIFLFINSLKESAQREEIQKAVEYVFTNYSRKITAAMVAEHVNISVNYFSHLFKKEIGEGFTDFLTKYRLEKAKEMLKATDLKVNEIAEKVGFDNIYYFSNVFRKIVGISPVEFKKGRAGKQQI